MQAQSPIPTSRARPRLSPEAFNKARLAERSSIHVPRPTPQMSLLRGARLFRSAMQA